MSREKLIYIASPYAGDIEKKSSIYCAQIFTFYFV